MANGWRDVTEQPILVITSGTCANVVANSTRCIQHCVQEQLTHLDKRARALATSGNFEAALNDVAMIRQLGPSSSVGYLCGGHVYSLQGRQKAAIDIYDKGLDAVPLSDPSYQRLVEARSMAQERDSKRIDFIKEFPIDIIENIASWILSKEIIAPSEIQEYLDVSRVWRQRLLMCIRDLHIEGTTDCDDLLGLIAPYCTALTLRSEASWLRQFMSNTPFPSLRVLSILRPLFLTRYSYEDEDEDDVNSGLILDTIISFQATTLTHLTIFVEEGCDIPFANIIRSCPHLVDLKMSWVDTNMSTAPTCCPNMKSLSFMINHGDEFDVDDITKRFPELERFMVTPFYYAGDLRIIQSNCPKLRVIGNSSQDCDDDDDDCTPPSSDDSTTIAVGVRSFLIKDDGHWLDEDHGVQCFDYVQSNDKLYSTNTPPAASTHGQHGCTELTPFKKLDLYPTYTMNANVGALFDDLIGLCELESAIVKLTIMDPLEDDMGGIERFIQYHNTIDSHLHTLILPQDVRLSNDALDALTTLPQLTTLGLSLPLVQVLFIADPIPDIVFVRLSNLKVKSLRLVMSFLLMNKAPTSLLTLMECPQLEDLQIYPACNPKDTYIRRALESKIPSVSW
ncbi:hypothetical protein O0I10_011462 [Lichtheimia ornata]|uniref:F-box domain-containing protein n=1 Tax=Lichtheimia ornata TaxID=688661 RepID=A0AAD7UUH3_9FUNG|nr:uncharacterized protein O0I10_011462 [Lichtheimia ornata]KAJ8652862.1 hypothetical protein O0I10_011462 [Lichtheimia ornata]